MKPELEAILEATVEAVAAGERVYLDELFSNSVDSAARHPDLIHFWGDLIAEHTEELGWRWTAAWFVDCLRRGWNRDRELECARAWHLTAYVPGLLDLLDAYRPKVARPDRPREAPSPAAHDGEWPVHAADRYVLLRELGAGATGVVYEALDLRSRVSVALKSLRFSLARDAEHGAHHRRVFDRSIQVQRQLPVGDCVLRMLDDGLADGIPYFTTELVDGESLAAILTRLRSTAGRLSAECLRRGGLPVAIDAIGARFSPAFVEAAAVLFERIARTLAAHHARGVHHRDVKPANILVGDDGRPYLLDFGNAYVEEMSSLTPNDAAVGTFPYMAPEVLNGRAGRSLAASDVWSLGVSLYETLTLRSPFRPSDTSELGATALEARVRHLVLRTDPPRQTTINPATDERLERILWHTLEKAPEHRYRDSDALAGDLRAYLERANLTGAPRLRHWTPMVRAVRRAAAPVRVAGAAVSVALVIGIAWWIAWLRTTGTLYIVGAPPVVQVDGVDVPTLRPIQLTAGRHVVAVTDPGRLQPPRSVLIRRGKQTELEFPWVGERVVLRSAANGVATVRDQFGRVVRAGLAVPTDEPITLPFGKYFVRVEASGSLPAERSFLVGESDPSGPPASIELAAPQRVLLWTYSPSDGAVVFNLVLVDLNHDGREEVISYSISPETGATQVTAMRFGEDGVLRPYRDWHVLDLHDPDHEPGSSRAAPPVRVSPPPVGCEHALLAVDWESRIVGVNARGEVLRRSEPLPDVGSVAILRPANREAAIVIAYTSKGVYALAEDSLQHLWQITNRTVQKNLLPVLLSTPDRNLVLIPTVQLGEESGRLSFVAQMMSQMGRPFGLPKDPNPYNVKGVLLAVDAENGEIVREVTHSSPIVPSLGTAEIEGKQRVCYATSDGRVHFWHPDAMEPRSFDAGVSRLHVMSVCDPDGDRWPACALLATSTETVLSIRRFESEASTWPDIPCVTGSTGGWVIDRDPSGDSVLGLLDLASGTFRIFEPDGRERASLPIPGYQTSMVRSVDVDGDGVCEVVIATTSHVHVLRIHPGSRIWSRRQPELIFGPEARDEAPNQRLLTVDHDGVMRGLDTANGRELWRLPPLAGRFGPIVRSRFEGEELLVAVDGGLLRRFDAATGEEVETWERWTTDHPPRFWAHGPFLTLLEDFSWLSSYDMRTGAVVAETPVKGVNEVGEVLVDDLDSDGTVDAVVFRHDDGNWVSRIDPEHRQTLWIRELEEYPRFLGTLKFRDGQASVVTGGDPGNRLKGVRRTTFDSRIRRLDVATGECIEERTLMGSIDDMWAIQLGGDGSRPALFWRESRGIESAPLHLFDFEADRQFTFMKDDKIAWFTTGLTSPLFVDVDSDGQKEILVYETRPGPGELTLGIVHLLSTRTMQVIRSTTVAESMLSFRAPVIALGRDREGLVVLLHPNGYGAATATRLEAFLPQK